MRDYSIVTPAFWIGKTGVQLRGDLPAQLLAVYLMTSPHSTMTGVFHCPVLYMAHETGIPFEGASKALRRLIEAGFCEYEEASETVFVVRMASFQIADKLKPGDNRIVGLKKEVSKMASSLLRSRFLAIYSVAFCLNSDGEKTSPFEAPLKPLRSQEQEQEQEQEQKKNSRVAAVADSTSKTISIKDLVSEGVEKQKAADWLVLRKAKRLPLTLSAWIDTKAEGERVGLTPADTVAHAVSCNWAGFKASWYAKDNGSPMYSGGIFAGAI